MVKVQEQSCYSYYKQLANVLTECSSRHQGESEEMQTNLTIYSHALLRICVIGGQRSVRCSSLPPCLLIIAVQQPGTFKLFSELQLVPDNLLFIQCYPSNSLLHTLHLHFVLFQLKDCVAKQHPTLSWKPWHVHSGYYGFCTTTVCSNFPLWIPCPTIRQVPPYPNDFLYQHLSVRDQPVLTHIAKCTLPRISVKGRRKYGLQNKMASIRYCKVCQE